MTTATIDRQLLLAVFKRAVEDHQRHHCWARACAHQHVECDIAGCDCGEPEFDGLRRQKVAVGPETVSLVEVDQVDEPDHHGEDITVEVCYTQGTGHEHHALYGVNTSTGQISLWAD